MITECGSVMYKDNNKTGHNNNNNNNNNIMCIIYTFNFSTPRYTVQETGMQTQNSTHLNVWIRKTN